MRITFVSPTVNMGGGTKVIVIYAQALARMGHRVRLVSPPAKAPNLSRHLRSLLFGPPEAAPASHLDGAGIDHHVLERWRPVADDDVPEADVVVATWWETAEWVHALDPSKGAKAYFVQHHEVFPYLPVARCHATYRFPMHKIVVARWLADVMARQYGDRAVDVVPNSIDPQQFWAPVRGKQASPTAGFLYSSAPFKGLEILLRAIAKLRRRLPGLRCVAFGSEPVRADLPLPPGCEFFFRPPQHRIREIYASCDVWLSASRSEGFNLPAMEAMACRTPVVSTRTGWPAEAIDSGRNGVLVDPDDAAGLVRGAEWALKLPDGEWRAVSGHACRTVAGSSWQESARRFERALYRACRRAAIGETAGGQLPCESF
jgi:glycosyltransferase involved in cell wall biosynthesis